MEKILVMITVGSEEEALEIAKALLEERLIACANLLGQVRSLYHWKGQLCDDREVLLFCKTQEHLFQRLSERVKSLHRYEVPEIVALSFTAGWAPYFQWVEAETTHDSNQS